MKERDSKDMLIAHLQMENVRLHNSISRLEQDARLCEMAVSATERENALLLKFKDEQIESLLLGNESLRKDYDREHELRLEAEKENASLSAEMGKMRREYEDRLNELQPAGELLEQARKNNLDSSPW